MSIIDALASLEGSESLLQSLYTEQLKGGENTKVEESVTAAATVVMRPEDEIRISENARSAQFNAVQGNFVRYGDAKSNSKYIESTLSDFGRQAIIEAQEQKSFVNQLDQLAAFVTSDNPTVFEKQIEEAVRRKRDKDVYEEIEKASGEMQDELEQATAEATAPKNAEGEPVTTAPVPGEGASEAPDIAPEPQSSPSAAETAKAQVAQQAEIAVEAALPETVQIDVFV